MIAPWKDILTPLVIFFRRDFPTGNSNMFFCFVSRPFTRHFKLSIHINPHDYQMSSSIPRVVWHHFFCLPSLEELIQIWQAKDLRWGWNHPLLVDSIWSFRKGPFALQRLREPSLRADGLGGKIFGSPMKWLHRSSTQLFTKNRSSKMSPNFSHTLKQMQVIL